jgi:thioredoxin 2
VARAAAATSGRALVLKVDTERHPNLASRFGVRNIPSFVLLRDGGVVAQHAGLVDHARLEQWLAEAGTPDARR